MSLQNPKESGSLAVRIADVTIELMTVETGLDSSLCRHLVEKNTRVALARSGLHEIPTDFEALSPLIRYQFAKKVFDLIADELRKRNVTERSITQLRADMAEFYKGVRNLDALPPKAAAPSPADGPAASSTDTPTPSDSPSDL